MYLQYISNWGTLAENISSLRKFVINVTKLEQNTQYNVFDSYRSKSTVDTVCEWA